MDWRVLQKTGIEITKRVLQKTLGNQCLTEKQLTAILVDAEVVVNSCPLVYVDEDVNSNVILRFLITTLSRRVIAYVTAPQHLAPGLVKMS